MTDAREIDIEVQADARDAVQSVNGLVRTFEGLLGTIGAVEAKIKLMNGGLDQAAKKASQALQTGGPQVQLRTAGLKGAVANLQSSPEVQNIKLEREFNRILEARRELYRRAAADNKSPAQARAAYRESLTAIGAFDASDGQARTASMKRTAAEAAKFQRELNDLAAVGVQKTAELQKKADDKRLVEATKAAAKFNRDQDQAERMNTARDLREARAADKARRLDLVGGANVQTRTEAYKGARTTIQSDAAAQFLKTEQQINKTLEARREIFRRSQTEGATPNANRSSYREALLAIGDRTPDVSQAAWMRKTNAEALKFQAEMLAIQNAGASKALLAQNEAAARSLAAQQAADQKKVAAAAKAQDRIAYAQWKRDHTEATGMNTRMDRDVAVAASRRPPPTRQERAAGSIQGIHDKLDDRGGAGFLGVQAKLLGNYAAIGAAISGLTFAASSTIKFQSALKQLQAISSATSIEMVGLKASILEVANASKFSTEEITLASVEMAQAGMTAQQIGQALPSVIGLATSVGATLKDSVGIVTSVLAVYNLSVERSADVSNLLTAALNKSKLTLDQVSLGIQYAGNAASQGGVQLEELISAFGAMAQVGIKSGSTLGTGLRQLITELENPTEKFSAALNDVGLTASDVDVKSQGLYGALKNLEDAGFDSSKAFDSLDRRAASAFASLSNNLPFMSALQAGIVGTSAATDAAAIQMDSFASQFQRLSNSVTFFVSTAGMPFLAMMQSIVGGMASAITVVAGWTGVLVPLGILLTSIASANFLMWLAKLSIGMLGGAASTTVATRALVVMALAQGQFALATGMATRGLIAFTLAMVASPVGILTLGIAALTAAFFGAQIASGMATAEIQKSTAAANEAAGKVAEYTGRISELDKFINTLIDRHSRLSQNVGEAGLAADAASQKFAAWGLVIDDQGRKVDGLIAKLRQLRIEQQREALVAAETMLTAQQDVSRKAVTAEVSGWNGVTNPLTLMGSKDRAKLDPKVRAALERTAKAGSAPSLADIQLLQGWARTNPNAPGAKRFGKALDAQAPRAALSTSAQRDVQGTTAVVSAGRAATTPEALARQVKADAAEKASADRLAAASKLKTPRERMAAVAASRAISAADLERNFGSIPAGPEGDALRAATPQYARARANAGLTSQSDTSATIQATAKRTKQLADAAAPGAERTRLQALAAEQMRDYKIKKAEEQGEPSEATLFADGEQATADAATVAADARRGNGGGGGGSRAASYASKGKAQRRAIETAAAQGGADDVLKAMLAEYVSTRKAEVKETSSGLSDTDMAQKLDDLDVELKDYSDKILTGKISEAKQLIADASARAAEDTLSGAINTQLAGGGSVADSLKAVADTQAQALLDAIDASNAAFKAANPDVDPSLSPTQKAAIQQMVRDAAQKAGDAAVAIQQAAFDGASAALDREAAKRDRVIAGKQLGIDLLSSPWGNRNIGDAHRADGARAAEGLAVDSARSEQTLAQGKMTAKGAQISGLEAALAGTTDVTVAESLKTQLHTARLEMEGLVTAADTADMALRRLTETAKPFTTFSEALGSAWRTFAEQAKVNQPVFEQMADGLVGVMDTAKTSMGTLFVSVLDGTKTMADAFRDFAKSVMAALLDLVAQILAKQIIMFVLSMFGGGLSPGAGAHGGANVSGPSNFQSITQGGTVRAKGYSGGGKIPTNVGSIGRDSVYIKAQPGEVIMNRSAVDMAGEDNLMAMNNAGGRQMNNVNQAATRVIQKEPDMVNVYVVAPNQQPPMGKKDIIATISDDIARGGSVKQLIKAVAMGGL
jgi:TP901 family phage tail tape measure protein